MRNGMRKFDEYNISLKGMKADSAVCEFQLDNLFFTHIDGPEVRKGNVKVTLTIKRTAQTFVLDFNTEGVVTVLCDRCLDEMEQPIVSKDKLKVKFGSEYAEEGTDIVIVPEGEGAINVAWFLYEFIVLAIPMKHVHAPGKCNKAMAGHLKKHLRVADPSEEGEFDEVGVEMDADKINVDEDNLDNHPIDPRWDDLEKIIDNN